MKTMKNFAAKQLTKKQMNEIKGGREFLCVCRHGEKPLTTVPGIDSVFRTPDLEAAVFLTQMSCPNGGDCYGL